MKKYLKVITSTFDEIATYRFNFTMWRVRTVLQVLTIYFLWLTVTPVDGEIFGYSRTLILTYVLGASLISSIVISTRTQEIGENINSGDLSNFLSKPWSYFGYWFARDLGDKAFNILFGVVELTILFFILKPDLLLQTDLNILILTLVAILFGLLINFFIGCLLGMIGFWSPEVWAPRFIFFILIGFFAGSSFPLDIFPSWAQVIFKFSPFTYLIYFPLQIYLDKFSNVQIVTGFTVAAVWVGLLFIATKFVWKKGLKIYSSQGS